MDDFEKHIRKNKDLFDDHKADKDKLWANIAKELKDDSRPVKRLWQSKLFKIAASIILVLTIAFATGLSTFSANDSEGKGYASEELQDIDMHYKNLVMQQVNLVKNLPDLSESDKTEFLSFMDELDDEYELLRVELENNYDNELVLESIVSNYKKRIELIENLLKRMKESKTKDDDYGYIL